MATKSIDHPSFGEAFRFWLKLGFISFGGPTGQIAIMQTELVEKKKWISQSRFLACIELLHAAARPGGAAAGHLCRLAASQNMGRHCRRCALRHSVDVRALGPELCLCSLRQYSVDCCGLLRTQAGGDGDCRIRRHPNWQEGAKKLRSCGALRHSHSLASSSSRCRFRQSCSARA